MKSQLFFAGMLALALAVTSEDASAELFRCQQPDGRVVFTDREDACPGADPYTPVGAVQTFRSSPTVVAPAAASAAPSNGAGASPLVALDAGAQPGLWREKKVNAAEELEALEQKWGYLNEYITHCNRHRQILKTDASGLRYEVSCDNIREVYAQVKTRLAEVRSYLAGKLEEECRRAGCLPGWIR